MFLYAIPFFTVSQLFNTYVFSMYFLFSFYFISIYFVKQKIRTDKVLWKRGIKSERTMSPRLRCTGQSAHLHMVTSKYRPYKRRIHNNHQGNSINHFEEVRLFITRYKMKAQCRDNHASRSCVPKRRDVYTEFIEPTIIEQLTRIVMS